MKEAKADLTGVAPDIIQADDLAILIDQIERQIEFAGFDGLKEIPSVELPNLGALRQATADLKQAVQDEQKLNACSERSWISVRGIARATGVPLP